MIESRKVQCIELEAAALKYVILDTDSFNFIDHSGVIALSLLFDFCIKRETQLLLVVGRIAVLDKLQQEQFFDKLGLQFVFPSLKDAVLFTESESSEEIVNSDSSKEVIQLMRSEDSNCPIRYGSLTMPTVAKNGDVKEEESTT